MTQSVTDLAWKCEDPEMDCPYSLVRLKEVGSNLRGEDLNCLWGKEVVDVSAYALSPKQIWR